MEQIQSLLNVMQNGFALIESQLSPNVHTATFILGTTGSGKSTIANCLCRGQMFCQEVLGTRELHCWNPLSAIKGGSNSVTSVPVVLSPPDSSQVFVDCPGSLDTDALQEITNVALIKFSMSRFHSLKILVVIN